MSLAQWFGDAGPAQASHNDIEGGVEVRQMSGGNINGFDPLSGSEHEPHRALMEQERAVLASLGSEMAVMAAKQLFGATNGRNAQPESQVAGKAKFPRVRQTLAVAQDDVGETAKLLKYVEERRDFSKRKEAGDVRKNNGRGTPDGLNGFQIWPGEGDHGRHESLGCCHVTDVRSSDHVESGGDRSKHHPTRQCALETDGLLRGKVPFMKGRHQALTSGAFQNPPPTVRHLEKRKLETGNCQTIHTTGEENVAP